MHSFPPSGRIACNPRQPLSPTPRTQHVASARVHILLSLLRHLRAESTAGTDSRGGEGLPREQIDDTRGMPCLHVVNMETSEKKKDTSVGDRKTWGGHGGTNRSLPKQKEERRNRRKDSGIGWKSEMILNVDC